MRATCREGILLVAVGISRNDTIVANLRERYEIVALVSSTVERNTVRIAETCIEEVPHVVLNSLVRLDLLRIVVNGTVLQRRTVELRTPGTVLVVGLVSVPTHTEIILHLGQTHDAFPLQTAVILNT